MADNFNLRSFLAENKLTKNAKLLSEERQQEAFQPKSKLEQIIQAAWMEKDLNKAKQLVIDLLEPSRVKTKDQMIQTIKGIQSKTRFDQYLANSLLKFEKLGLSEESEDIQEGINWEIVLDGRQVNNDSIQIDGVDMDDYPDFSDAYIAYAEFEDGTPLSEDELMRLEEENYGIVNDLAHDSLHEVKEPVMESTLTVKERRLVEMVQNALGITEEEHEFGTNALTGEPLPDPKSQMVAEDEMVQENPLPKYKNIDELMSSIEHGTNEAAHKYKMGRMKEIADALEAKVTSLEEGENAEHIDQKAVKSMKKDIMTLRKGVDKLEKEFEKKFANKKEKKEDK